MQKTFYDNYKCNAMRLKALHKDQLLVTDIVNVKMRLRRHVTNFPSKYVNYQQNSKKQLVNI